MGKGAYFTTLIFKVFGKDLVENKKKSMFENHFEGPLSRVL